MKKTITIIGATGKVGGKISEILLHEGHHLKLIAKTADKLKKFKDKDAEIITADITDVEVLTAAFKNSDSVYVMTPPDFTRTLENSSPTSAEIFVKEAFVPLYYSL